MMYLLSLLRRSSFFHSALMSSAFIVFSVLFFALHSSHSLVSLPRSRYSRTRFLLHSISSLSSQLFLSFFPDFPDPPCIVPSPYFSNFQIFYSQTLTLLYVPTPLCVFSMVSLCCCLFPLKWFTLNAPLNPSHRIWGP